MGHKPQKSRKLRAVAFALNIDANQGASNARGVPTLYDRFDGNWHQCLSLRNGNVGIGTTDPQFRLHASRGAAPLKV
jgi:hypothetical protein